VEFLLKILKASELRWATFRYLLKGRVGVLADSELDKRRQMVLLSVLESMQTLPAQPPSGRIAHHFLCTFVFFVLKYENPDE
jgi:hypothetical protein